MDLLVNGEVQLLINTPLGKKSQYDDYAMRRAAIAYKVPYITTMSAASAASSASGSSRRILLRAVSRLTPARVAAAMASGWVAPVVALGATLFVVEPDA